MEWLIGDCPLTETPDEAIVARSDICGDITNVEFQSAWLSFLDEAIALGIADEHTTGKAAFEALGIQDPERTFEHRIIVLRTGEPQDTGSA